MMQQIEAVKNKLVILNSNGYLPFLKNKDTFHMEEGK